MIRLNFWRLWITNCSNRCLSAITSIIDRLNYNRAKSSVSPLVCSNSISRWRQWRPPRILLLQVLLMGRRVPVSLPRQQILWDLVTKSLKIRLSRKFSKRAILIFAPKSSKIMFSVQKLSACPKICSLTKEKEIWSVIIISKITKRRARELVLNLPKVSLPSALLALLLPTKVERDLLRSLIQPEKALRRKNKN